MSASRIHCPTRIWNSINHLDVLSLLNINFTKNKIKKKAHKVPSIEY